MGYKMSLEVTEEMLGCALRRLNKLALQTSDHEHQAKLNKVILTVNQALDLIKETKQIEAIIDKIEVKPYDEKMHNFEESACFDPFAKVFGITYVRMK